jgi:exodeoxyribonuclease VII small subunit
MGAEKVKPSERSLAELTFEEALRRLEQIVKELEEGELPLEQSIASFQEGMQLAKICRDKLDQAEQRIELLMKEGDVVKREPFSPEEEM